MNCRDACGAWVVDQEAATSLGWTYLAVAGGYRCGACTRALAAAAGLVGADGDPAFVDTVPADSRGALPKETASTIANSVVKS